MEGLVSLILAAGQGKRMRSNLPKVLHEIDGLSLAEYVLQCATKAGIGKHCIVVGHKKEMVEEVLGAEGRKFAVQKEPLGTGHAVSSAAETLKNMGAKHCLILCGDTPCLTEKTIQEFLRDYEKNPDQILVLSTEVKNPHGYGRMIRGGDGELICIREEKDCSEDEVLINEINTGIYLGSCTLILDLLKDIDNQNAQGEYYLTDIITNAREKGVEVKAINLGIEEEFLGVNSPEQLEEAKAVIRSRRI